MSWRIPSPWRAPAHRASSRLSSQFPGLKPRLSLLAGWVQDASVIADIGTDHGSLPAALLRAGRASFAYAIDQSAEAIVSADARLARSQCEGIAAVLVGDGFEPIPRGSGAPRVDCAILAGMGAENALEIIERGLALGHRPSRIVIQPAAKEREVRRRMPSHGYELVKESFVVDGNRLFLGLAFDSCSGERAPLKEEDLVAGPLLRREGGPLYRAWLATQLDWLEPLLQRPGPTKPSLLTRRSILERLVREQMKMRSPGEPELLPFDTIEP